VGDPLRILHVVVNMNRGGAEMLIMNLYRNVDRSKVQFDFLTCKEGEFDSEILKLGGKVHRIPYITDVGHFRYVKELNSFFTRNNEYKIVHSHMDKMSGLILRSAKKVGIPLRISHSHNTSSEGRIAAKLYKWLIGNLILPNATNLVACSTNSAKWLFKGQSRSTKIIKNGIEIEKFTYNPKSREVVRDLLNLDPNTFVIGHIGRLDHQKNHTFLIDIFSKFNQVNGNSVLILVGDGPMSEDIKRKVLELGIADKVKFLGIRTDIHLLLQAFDVFVFPSLHEGLPVSLIEAQGSGLPCLISDRITKEVNIGSNLVDFVPLTDKKLWVKKMKDIASNPIDRISNVPFSMNGYDIKEEANNLENFYLSITG
jgi:glycosyltransferase involved in cell wall biosynthesis